MYICGQKELISRIDNLTDKNKFPRFCIISGGEGFGKKVLSEYISKKLGCVFVPCDIKVESVRETIYNAYAVSNKTLYMFFDCDNMSLAAKNALLKVTEEPPNNAYFIMTVRDLSSVLGTLISRATVFNMSSYTIDDIKEYAKEKNYSFDSKVEKLVYQICICPKDVAVCSKIDVSYLYDLADKFIQYIGSVPVYNEFKIVSSLSTKKDDGKLDPVLFLRCVMICCNSYILNECPKEDTEVFYKIIKQTSKHLSELCQKGSSKQLVLDNWILNTHLDISGGEL